MSDSMILCSSWNEVNRLVCDLPLGHKGPHRGTVEWGDEKVGDDDE